MAGNEDSFPSDRRRSLTDMTKSCRTVSIPFETDEQAATALRVISVDKILRSDSVTRVLSTDGSSLVA